MTEYKLIPLRGKHGDGKYAIVDVEDYEKLLKYPWRVATNGYVVYGKMVSGKFKTFYMHRLILGCSEEDTVDHANQDKLDNRKKNIRVGTQAKNTFNTSGRLRRKGKYKGIIQQKSGRWYARINAYKETYYLGTYDTQEEAALAYDKAAKELHGEWACLNFPKYSHPEP